LAEKTMSCAPGNEPIPLGPQLANADSASLRFAVPDVAVKPLSPNRITPLATNFGLAISLSVQALRRFNKAERRRGGAWDRWSREPSSWRASAVEKDLVETFKVTSNIADKIEKVQVVGEVVLVTATWSATLQGKDGPIQARGFWGGVYVRDGDAWKTHLAIINRALPSPQQETKQ
jgi:hypothetical protein